MLMSWIPLLWPWAKFAVIQQVLRESSKRSLACPLAFVNLLFFVYLSFVICHLSLCYSLTIRLLVFIAYSKSISQCNLYCFILLMLYLHVWIGLWKQRNLCVWLLNRHQQHTHKQTNKHSHTHTSHSPTHSITNTHPSMSQRCEYGRLFISTYNDFVSNGSVIFPFEHINILRNISMCT